MCYDRLDFAEFGGSRRIDFHTVIDWQGHHIHVFVMHFSANNFFDNPRSVETFDKFRVFQGSTNVALVDVYIVETGTAITNRTMDFFALGTGIVTEYRGFVAGSYDIVVTESTTKDILASLIGIEFTNGAVTEFVILDTADPNVLELRQVQ